MNAAHRVGRICFLVSLSCVGTAAAQPAAKGASPSPQSASSPATGDAATQARALYEKGRSEAVAGHWQDAYATLRAAYAWFPHWQIAGGLGDAAFVLGKYPEAVEMLSQNLREANNLTAQERTDTEKRHEEARKKCGALAVEAPDGAELRVDGAPAGKLPLRRVLYVLPGAHTVEIVTAAGATGTKQTVTVAAGETARVATQSEAARPAAPGAPAEAPTATAGARMPPPGAAPSTTPTGSPAGETPAAAPKPSLVPAIVLGASGVVALGAGFGLFAWSEAKGAEALKARDAYNELEPDEQTDSAKKGVGDLLRDQDRRLTGATVAWISAAALGAGAVGYAVYRESAGKETTGRGATAKPTVRWLPALSPQAAGVVVQGSF